MVGILISFLLGFGPFPGALAVSFRAFEVASRYHGFFHPPKTHPLGMKVEGGMLGCQVDTETKNTYLGLSPPSQYASDHLDYFMFSRGFQAKPSFATITGKGDNPNNRIVNPISMLFLFIPSCCCSQKTTFTTSSTAATTSVVSTKVQQKELRV